MEEREGLPCRRLREQGEEMYTEFFPLAVYVQAHQFSSPDK